MILSALLGTYLDLFFIGKGLYSYPARPFSSVFSIDVFFTLAALPIMTGLFLKVTEKQNRWRKGIVIGLLSIGMVSIEKMAEAIGFFVHRDDWSHVYSVGGYALFLLFVTLFHEWINGER